MYDAPFDGPTVLAWVLAALALVLLGLRALRLERRRAPGADPSPGGGVRALDRGLVVLAALAVTALAAALVVVVVGALA